MNLKEDDVVMCTVKSIEGTTVFVDIEGHGKGTIVMSEVAAGRIRNLREYVFPNKKIVCKILNISQDGHIQLTLRRVTGKEREELQEKYKKEKTFISLLKTIIKDPQNIINSIKEKYELWEFFEEAQEKPSLLEKFLKKEDSTRLAQLMAEKEEREKTAKKIFTLQSTAEKGVRDIQELLKTKDIEIHYLGSSKFSASAKGSDFKEANNKLSIALTDIEKKAKEKKAVFELKEK